jgi:A/G-specific adenine glycosylase
VPFVLSFIGIKISAGALPRRAFRRHDGPEMRRRKASTRTPPKAAVANGVAPARRDHVRRLLAWYDRARRALPWRALPGETPDPYRVWLSEIMLQQTTVAAVGPYFDRFVARWPDVARLAAAPLDAVLAEWQGLGYYARARNLKACAEVVARDLGGRFPDRAGELARLPGIGPYTAAAVAAIAFGRAETVVDGNVERVIARLFAVTEPLPGAKARLRDLAATLTPKARAGDYAQAMMDLGATICTPRSPACILCPLNMSCAARVRGIAATLPARARKPARPTRRAVAWVCANRAGAVLLRRRADKGLLGGMWEVPSSDWVTDGAADAVAPVAADWCVAPGVVVHVFSHFRLELEVRSATIRAKDAARFGAGVKWVARGALGAHALPSVMKKVLAAGTSPAPRRGAP